MRLRGPWRGRKRVDDLEGSAGLEGDSVRRGPRERHVDGEVRQPPGALDGHDAPQPLEIEPRLVLPRPGRDHQREAAAARSGRVRRAPEAERCEGEARHDLGHEGLGGLGGGEGPRRAVVAAVDARDDVEAHPKLVAIAGGALRCARLDDDAQRLGRQRHARRREVEAAADVGGRRCGGLGNRNVPRQRDAARDAVDLAHHEARVDLDPPHTGRVRRDDGIAGEEDIALVAERRQETVRLAVDPRRGPPSGADPRAGSPPRQLGGSPGVTGVAPVDVPAGIDGEEDADAHGLAGTHRRRIDEQLRQDPGFALVHPPLAAGGGGGGGARRVPQQHRDNRQRFVHLFAHSGSPSGAHSPY